MGVLRQKVSANGAPVLFQPPVPSHLLAQYLGASDLLLIGSKHEGLPTVALEALACGTPVVATPVGILPELIKPGLNGFIAHSESEFQSSVEQALCDTGWNREECRASVAMFAWQNVAPAILEVYREITS